LCAQIRRHPFTPRTGEQERTDHAQRCRSVSIAVFAKDFAPAKLSGPDLSNLDMATERLPSMFAVDGFFSGINLMLTTDPRTMNLVALGMAKVTYGALKILKRHLGNDLELAMIGFAVVMRTRRDLFQLVERDGLNADTVAQIASERGFYTSLYEVHQYTGINRGTIRRKMTKLQELGILEKVDEDKWHLVDFEHGEEVRPAIMLRELLQNYMAITNKLEALLPDEMQPLLHTALTDLGPLEAKALLDEDVERKVRRGLVAHH